MPQYAHRYAWLYGFVAALVLLFFADNFALKLQPAHGSPFDFPQAVAWPPDGAGGFDGGSGFDVVPGNAHGHEVVVLDSGAPRLSMPGGLVDDEFDGFVSFARHFVVEVADAHEALAVAFLEFAGAGQPGRRVRRVSIRLMNARLRYRCTS